jgi:hypothetical protein
MDKEHLELYTDYLLSTFGYATATGLSAMVNGQVSHDQITRFLSGEEYTSKDLWLEVKATVRKVGALDFIRQPDGQYIFLEINGNGQFLWAEELSGVEVSKALANLLVGATPALSQYG